MGYCLRDASTELYGVVRRLVTAREVFESIAWLEVTKGTKSLFQCYASSSYICSSHRRYISSCCRCLATWPRSVTAFTHTIDIRADSFLMLSSF
jgi:hypothetical protein